MAKEREGFTISELQMVAEAKNKANTALEVSNAVMKSLDKFNGIYVDIAELKVELKNLSLNVKEGFIGVHSRQDKTNGNVIDNRKDIDLNTGWRNRMIGALVISNVVLVPLMFMVLKHYLG